MYKVQYTAIGQMNDKKSEKLLCVRTRNTNKFFPNDNYNLEMNIGNFSREF